MSKIVILQIFKSFYSSGLPNKMDVTSQATKREYNKVSDEHRIELLRRVLIYGE
jgi:hypothetical protein